MINMKKCLTGRILRMVAFLLIALQLIVISVSANNNILSLYKNKPEDNTPFNVVNMFPGDYITQFYNVRVSCDGYIKVYFTADVRPGYEKLAEVLKCKVVMPDENKILYDGLMNDIPDLEHSISAVNKTVDLGYEISVYLDTSVGNEYQDKQLIADFKWWAYTANEGYPGVGTPDGPGGSVTPSGDGADPIIPPDDGGAPTIPPEGGDEPITPPDEGGDKPVTPPEEDIPSDHQPNVPQPPQADGGEPAPEDSDRPTGELIDPPRTGDLANPVLWIILICVSLFVILLILFFRKKKSEPEEKNPVIKKLTVCIIIIIILAICLCITTFALVYSIVTVDENIFKTGTVEINLYDGKPIITQDEFLFEPGMTVEKDFFIENESSEAVYYKLYFDNVDGGLQKVLDIEILDKENGTSLYSGKAQDFKRESCESAVLLLNEKRTLTAVFHYPKESGNETQNMSLSFDLCAVATQTSNNPDRKFD